MRDRAPGSGHRAPKGAQGGGAAPIQVFYDGACELCASTRAWAKERDVADRLHFVDFRDAAIGALPVTRAQLEREMWVRRADGTLCSGLDGTRAVLAALPRWRWLAILIGIPPLRWLGVLVYLAVARHRARL